MQGQEEVKSMLIVSASQHKLSAHTEWYCNMGRMEEWTVPTENTFHDFEWSDSEVGATETWHTILKHDIFTCENITIHGYIVNP